MAMMGLTGVATTDLGLNQRPYAAGKLADADNEKKPTPEGTLQEKHDAAELAMRDAQYTYRLRLHEGSASDLGLKK